ncbi:transcriptional protein SWT1 [Suncus etruscus]|uniref:transcriptional protein SWT1 n=1 Tax=Suncus etruscus TaxID=109475 RepID=UPI00210F80D0|nr:transcriptional protein SWT1 [Suncus etruscus]
MSNKESCGKKEKAWSKGPSSSLSFEEKDVKARRSASCLNTAGPRWSVTAEKRKLKSDPTDFVPYSVKRPELKRLKVETDDVLRKRPTILASSQGPVKLQDVPHSSSSLSISQGPSLNGVKKDIIRGLDFKPKDTELANSRSKLDSGIKGPQDVQPKAEGMAKGRNWPHGLATKGLRKEPKLVQLSRTQDSSGRSILEKCKRIQFAQGCSSDKLTQEPLPAQRRKIHFRIPVRTRNPLQRLMKENAFISEAHESKAEEEEKKRGLGTFQMEPISQLSPAESTFKPPLRTCKGKEQLLHKGTDTRPGGDESERFEAPCPSVSPESNQDSDEEMQIVEELHAARMGKSVDLGELTSMEIDLVEDDMHSSAASTTSDTRLLIVIDTNILMNHLKFVRSLKTKEIPGFDKIVLIIPWVVIQELDRMKAGKLLKHVQHKAIPAVHFINDGLRDPDRQLWGQPIQLAAQKFYGLSDENNDDRVLICCLQYQELFPCSLVILCTDDKNLRSKGLISGVKSLSKTELQAECVSLSLSTDLHSQHPQLKHQFKTEIKSSEGHPKEDHADSELSAQLDDIMSHLEKLLGLTLSSVLETEMKLAFGNLWLEVLYLKPPWTLIHLLQCFRKHWMAVFGLVMSKNLLATIESIYDNLSNASKGVDFKTVKFLLQDSKTLLLAFSARSNYDGVLPQAFTQVNSLLQTIAEVKVKLQQAPPENMPVNKPEDASLVKSQSQEIAIFPGSPLPQASRHQEIWSILEQVWITIYQNSSDVFQRLGSDSPLSLKIASFEESFLSLQKLLAAVKDILEGIQRILAPNSNYQDVETLYNSLIKYEVNTHVRFTAQELYDCVSLSEYREKLTIGCRQLVDLEHTMQQCQAKAYLEAHSQGWHEGRPPSAT